MKRYKLILISIIVLAALLRLTKLDRIPNGFVPEEVSNGWNAYSILKTGRDEWGNFLPLIFKETGGFKLALNSYLIVPSIAAFGVNEFAVRLPVAISGILAVWLTFVLVKLVFKRENFALAASLLLAISPWHISMSRYAIDVNLGVSLFLLGLIFFIKAKTRPKFIILSAVFFALTYYTYFNYVVFTVLFILGLTILQRKWFWQNRKFSFIFWLIQIIFLLPYILQPSLTIRFSQATSVGAIGRINQIHEHREACLHTYPQIICRILYNKPFSRGIEISKNYINHYSTTTLFLYGAQLGLSGMPDRWGFFYLFEFGLLIVGIGALTSRKQWQGWMLLWLFLYGLPSSLAGEAHMWRMLTLLPLPQIICGFGLVAISQKIKFPLLKFAVTLVISAFVFWFLADYTSFFPYSQSKASYFGFRDVYAYTKNIEKNYETIVMSPAGLGFEQSYIYYLFYTQYDPRSFQLNIDVDRQEGEQKWVKVNRIGKWIFENDVRNIVFNLPDKTLLIADGSFNEFEPLPKNVMLPKVIHTIYYPNGTPAFKVVELYKNPEYKVDVK